jgi:hypothetical protein
LTILLRALEQSALVMTESFTDNTRGVFFGNFGHFAGGFFPCPHVIGRPDTQTLYDGEAASFRVTAAGIEPLSFQWRRNGVPLLEGGRFTGTQSSTLLIRPVTFADAGGYDVVISNSCGTTSSLPAGLTVLCYANCDSSTTPPVLNVNDFVCFAGRFAAGDPYANCDGSTAIPVLNVNDFVCFIGRVAGGCP